VAEFYKGVYFTYSFLKALTWTLERRMSDHLFHYVVRGEEVLKSVRFQLRVGLTAGHHRSAGGPNPRRRKVGQHNDADLLFATSLPAPHRAMSIHRRIEPLRPIYAIEPRTADLGCGDPFSK